MAQDATGATTPKGIPKYNTAADPPSGKGFNAAMDQIDTILSDYAQKPSGTATGEAMVWNGSAWARSSVTRLSTVRPQDLGQDAASSGQVLAWNGSIWAPAAGSGMSLIQWDVTEKGAINTVAETTLFNSLPSITANSLGANGAIHLRAWGRAQQGTTTSLVWTWRIKLGATTIIAPSSAGGGATDTEGRWNLHIVIRNNGATNSQVTYMASGNNQGTQTWFPNEALNSFPATSAVDTTSTQALDFTVQMGTAGAANYGYRTGSVVWIDTTGI